jgi:GTPase
VQQVLEQIEAQQIPQLIVMNKIDVLDQPAKFEPGERPRVWLSAQSGAGIPELRQALASLLPSARAASWDGPATERAIELP